MERHLDLFYSAFASLEALQVVQFVPRPETLDFCCKLSISCFRYTCNSGGLCLRSGNKL